LGTASRFKVEFSLRDESTKWIVRAIALLFIVLCANALKMAAEPRPLYLQIINGFILSLLINGTLLLSVSKIGMKFWYVFIFPLILSGFAVAFVLWAYHFILIPVAIGLHLWVGYRLFCESRR
jgi:hypothetical protein